MRFIIFLLLILTGLHASAVTPVVVKECGNCYTNQSFATQARFEYRNTTTRVIIFNRHSKQVRQYELIKGDPQDLGFDIIYPVNLGVPNDLSQIMNGFINAYNAWKNQQVIEVPPFGIPGAIPYYEANIRSVTDLIRISGQQNAMMIWLQSRPNFQNFLNETDNIVTWIHDYVFDAALTLMGRDVTRFTVKFPDGTQIDVDYNHDTNRYNIKMDTARDASGNLFPSSQAQASGGGQYIVSPTTYSVWAAWLGNLGFTVESGGGVPAKIECFPDGTCIVTPL
ncbi:MAG: hypothetical protein R3E90_12975 [Marinicella sp.]